MMADERDVRPDGPQASSHGKIEMDANDMEIEVEVERAEGVRGRAGQGIDRAADAVRRKAWEAEDRGGAAGRAAPAAHRVADEMGDAAEYIREHELQEMRGDFERAVRRHPIRSVLMAVGIGYLFGKILR